MVQGKLSITSTLCRLCSLYWSFPLFFCCRSEKYLWIIFV